MPATNPDMMKVSPVTGMFSCTIVPFVNLRVYVTFVLLTTSIVTLTGRVSYIPSIILVTLIVVFALNTVNESLFLDML